MSDVLNDSVSTSAYISHCYVPEAYSLRDFQRDDDGMNGQTDGRTEDDVDDGSHGWTDRGPSIQPLCFDHV